jgi:hypothetical protein
MATSRSRRSAIRRGWRPVRSSIRRRRYCAVLGCTWRRSAATRRLRSASATARMVSVRTRPRRRSSSRKARRRGLTSRCRWRAGRGSRTASAAPAPRRHRRRRPRTGRRAPLVRRAETVRPSTKLRSLPAIAASAPDQGAESRLRRRASSSACYLESAVAAAPWLTRRRGRSRAATVSHPSRDSCCSARARATSAASSANWKRARGCSRRPRDRARAAVNPWSKRIPTRTCPPLVGVLWAGPE